MFRARLLRPCVCRSARGSCDHPLNTCFGLNFYGQLKKKAGERSETAEFAAFVSAFFAELNEKLK